VTNLLQRPAEEWLMENSKGGTMILSACNGAEALADAGLLVGRRATANCVGIDGFEKRYPEVDWVQGPSYVEDGNVVSMTGVTSGVNGTLHVVTKFVGNEAANDLAREVGYPDGRSGSSPGIPVNHLATSDAALFVLNAAYGWGKPSVGVALHSLHGRLDHPFPL
jgi:transcriptional regulator GlxA family with amidase domain